MIFDPEQEGLAAAGGILGQLSGPSRMPVNFGSILGQAGAAAMASQQKAFRAQQEFELKKRQLDLEEGKPISVSPGSILADRKGRPLLDNPHMRGGTVQERDLKFLTELQLKKNAGKELSPAEELEAQAARARLTQIRQEFDPVTQKMVTLQPLVLPPAISVGRFKEEAAVTPPGGAAPGQSRPNEAPSMDFGRRRLDTDQEKVLRDAGEHGQQLEKLLGTLPPNVGNWGLDVAGSLGTAIGRRLPDDWAAKVGKTVGKPNIKQEAEWWQQYHNWLIDVRHSKFGATLTTGEKAAFEAATSKPSDDNATIQKNIVLQLNLVRNRLIREMNSIERGGYNTEQGERLAGLEPTSKEFKLENGTKVVGVKSYDGNYYVTRNGKRFRVEE